MLINKLDSLSLRDLRAVLHLLETKNFHRAAAKCSVSQPALSSIIKKVENLLEIKLFDRSSRTCIPTAEGKRIGESIREILIKATALIEKQDRPPLSTKLRLGFIPTIGPFILPKLLPSLLKSYPSLELSFSEARTDELLTLVSEGNLDGAVIALPSNSPKLAEFPLFQDRLVLAVNGSDSLAKRKRISADNLDPKKLLIMEQGHCLRSQSLQVCSGFEGDAKTVFSTGLDTVLFMIESGAGYSIVPLLAVKNNLRLKKSKIKIVEFKAPTPFRTIGIIARRDSRLYNDIEELSRFIKESSSLVDLE